jgi:hypothetical protein
MVRALLAAGVVAVSLSVVSAAEAQQPAPQSTSKPPPQAQSQPQAPPPTGEAMGVSLKSIRQKTSIPAASEGQSGTGLRYDFFVDVFGQRPAIDFFKDFDLSTKGPVRYGSVTHQEILDAATPFPFHIYTGGINVPLGGKKK